MDAPTDSKGRPITLYGADGKPLNTYDLHKKDDRDLPHVWTFSAIIRGAYNTYFHQWDEAMRASYENALAMRRDAYLMALIRERKEGTVSLRWHLEPDNAKDPYQQAVCNGLKRIVEATPRLRRLQRYLMEALWYGRYGSKLTWKWAEMNLPAPNVASSALPGSGGGTGFTRTRCLTVKQHRPINGDKIGHHHDGTPYVLIHAGESSNLKDAEVITTSRGHAVALSGTWRERVILHSFDPDDADYFEAEMAEQIHGVGIRSRLYFASWLRNEYFSWVSDAMERLGLGVVYIEYPAGNPTAEAEAKEVARTFSRKSVFTIPVDPQGRERGGAIKVVEAPTAGAQVVLGLQQYLDKIIERFVIGQTLSAGTEGSGLGGSGVAALHADTKSRIIQADAHELAETLTGGEDEPGLISIIKRHTYPWADFPIRWAFEIESPNAEEKLGAVSMAFNMGVDFNKDEVRSLTGMSDPTPDDEVISAASLQQPAQQLMAGDQADQSLPASPDGQGSPQGGGQDPQLMQLMQALGQKPPDPKEQAKKGAAQLRRQGEALRYAGDDDDDDTPGIADAAQGVVGKVRHWVNRFLAPRSSNYLRPMPATHRRATKAVDAAGQPAVVYFGSRKPFRGALSMSGTPEPGMFVSEHHGTSTGYSSPAGGVLRLHVYSHAPLDVTRKPPPEEWDRLERIFARYGLDENVSLMKRARHSDDPFEWFSAVAGGDRGGTLRRALQAAGYDAVKHLDYDLPVSHPDGTVRHATNWMVLHPSQLYQADSAPSPQPSPDQGTRQYRRVDPRRVKDQARQGHPSPTEAQRAAGNYRMGHVRFHGLDLTIEVPKGRTRTKTGKDGKQWSRTMLAHYGYLRRTEGKDGEQVDCYLGPHPESEIVFVVNQRKASGAFDEHKVMLGYTNLGEARAAYLAHYPKGWKVGDIVPMTMRAFKQWLRDGDTGKPVKLAADGTPERYAQGDEPQQPTPQPQPRPQQPPPQPQQPPPQPRPAAVAAAPAQPSRGGGKGRKPPKVHHGAKAAELLHDIGDMLDLPMTNKYNGDLTPLSLTLENYRQRPDLHPTIVAGLEQHLKDLETHVNRNDRAGVEQTIEALYHTLASDSGSDHGWHLGEHINGRLARGEIFARDGTPLRYALGDVAQPQEPHEPPHDHPARAVHEFSREHPALFLADLGLRAQHDHFQDLLAEHDAAAQRHRGEPEGGAFDANASLENLRDHRHLLTTLKGFRDRIRAHNDVGGRPGGLVGSWWHDRRLRRLHNDLFHFLDGLHHLHDREVDGIPFSDLYREGETVGHYARAEGPERYAARNPLSPPEEGSAAAAPDVTRTLPGVLNPSGFRSRAYPGDKPVPKPHAIHRSLDRDLTWLGMEHVPTAEQLHEPAHVQRLIDYLGNESGRRDRLAPLSPQALRRLKHYRNWATDWLGHLNLMGVEGRVAASDHVPRDPQSQAESSQRYAARKGPTSFEYPGQFAPGGEGVDYPSLYPPVDGPLHPPQPAQLQNRERPPHPQADPAMPWPGQGQTFPQGLDPGAPQGGGGEPDEGTATDPARDPDAWSDYRDNRPEGEGGEDEDEDGEGREHDPDKPLDLSGILGGLEFADERSGR